MTHANSCQVIVLNGPSSAGKSGIARCLQAILPEPWLALGVDTLIAAMPASMRPGEGVDIGPDGAVTVGAAFRALDDAWTAGVAAMVRAGAHVIVDEVFLGGAAGQRRWRAALDGLPTLWVGVHCDPDVLAGREIARGDRAPGMAASQVATVHQGVEYDIEVDTTHTEAMDCARAVAKLLS
jgi:chloramphenicol 3-O phosphotransferase